MAEYRDPRQRTTFLLSSLIIAIISLSLTSCPSATNNTPTSPYNTIAWQPDGTGFTQFKTNDPSEISFAYRYIIPSSSMPNGITKTGVKQDSGFPNALLGMVFGYLNTNSYWEFSITNSGNLSCEKYNGLAWQTTGVTTYTLAAGVIVQGAGVENDLSVSYDGISTVTCYVNTTLAATITGVPGLTGSGTGYIITVDTSESFPAIPLDARYKQY